MMVMVPSTRTKRVENAYQSSNNATIMRKNRNCLLINRSSIFFIIISYIHHINDTKLIGKSDKLVITTNCKRGNSFLRNPKRKEFFTKFSTITNLSDWSETNVSNSIKLLTLNKHNAKSQYPKLSQAYHLHLSQKASRFYCTGWREWKLCALRFRPTTEVQNHSFTKKDVISIQST